MKNNLFIKIMKNGGLFSILIIITFYYLFKNLDTKTVIETISSTNINYLLIAVLAMMVFISGEAINFNRNLKALGYKTSFFKCLNYSINGFFFCSITPSASGGQPMQVYKMYKDDIKVSHSTLVLFVEFIFFQTVTILYALIGFIGEYSLLSQHISSLRYLFIIGISINTFMLIAIFMVLFNNELLVKILNKIVGFLNRIGIKRANSLNEKVLKIIDDYKDCSSYIVSNKGIVLKTFLTKCVQILAMYSVPYLVYRSFGFNEYSIFMFISIQSVLFITVSALPLPGAIGVSENGFLILYKLLFPKAVLSEAMLLSRGINFYLLVFLCGVYILTRNIMDSRNTENNDDSVKEENTIVEDKRIRKVSFESLSQNRLKRGQLNLSNTKLYKIKVNRLRLNKVLLEDRKIRANV